MKSALYNSFDEIVSPKGEAGSFTPEITETALVLELLLQY